MGGQEGYQSILSVEKSVRILPFSFKEGLSGEYVALKPVSTSSQQKDKCRNI